MIIAFVADVLLGFFGAAVVLAFRVDVMTAFVDVSELVGALLEEMILIVVPSNVDCDAVDDFAVVVDVVELSAFVVLSVFVVVVFVLVVVIAVVVVLVWEVFVVVVV